MHLEVLLINLCTLKWLKESKHSLSGCQGHAGKGSTRHWLASAARCCCGSSPAPSGTDAPPLHRWEGWERQARCHEGRVPRQAVTLGPRGAGPEPSSCWAATSRQGLGLGPGVPSRLPASGKRCRLEPGWRHSARSVAVRLRVWWYF